MRIVFDENVPWPLRRLLPGHEVTSAQREGFGGMENGELLASLNGKFDVFLIADKNLRYQQNLDERMIAIIELPTNRWPVLKDCGDEIMAALDSASRGSYTVIELH